MHPSTHMARFDPDRGHDVDSRQFRPFAVFSNCFGFSCFTPIFRFNPDRRMDQRCFHFVRVHDHDNDVMMDLGSC